MSDCKESTCIQKTTIALLDKDKTAMAKNIEQISIKVDTIGNDVTEIKNFILTMPIYFVSKAEFEKLEKETTDFKASVNYKVAGIAGWCSVAMYFINKLF